MANVQNTPDFNQFNTAAIDFFKNASLSWLDMVNGSLTASNDARPNGASWLFMDILKQGVPNGAFTSINCQKEAFQKMLSSCLEQQKLYSDLAKAGFTCATRTMETMRNGVQNHNDPADTLKACQELAANYCRECSAFIEGEFGQLTQNWGVPGAKEEKGAKTETVKSKAQS
jgi:hypothetical protein